MKLTRERGGKFSKRRKLTRYIDVSKDILAVAQKKKTDVENRPSENKAFTL